MLDYDAKKEEEIKIGAEKLRKVPEQTVVQRVTKVLHKFAVGKNRVCIGDATMITATDPINVKYIGAMKPEITVEVPENDQNITFLLTQFNVKNGQASARFEVKQAWPLMQ